MATPPFQKKFRGHVRTVTGNKGFFLLNKYHHATSKWWMASNVRISLIIVSTKNRIFRAKRQLSLIPINRTATLPAALSNLLSVQCNVQHWTEYKTTLASVRPVSVQTAITVNIVSVDRNWLSSVLDQSSPNLEYNFPLTSQRKYFVSSPWNGRGEGHVTP